jgi:acyl carrier protein
VPEDFDLLTNGVVDSFGILEMITAIEEQFNLQLDMANLDAEQLTILGPLCRYVAENAI